MDDFADTLSERRYARASTHSAERPQEVLREAALLPLNGEDLERNEFMAIIYVREEPTYLA